MKYRPSNGTAGECFFEEWCAHCTRDAEMNGSKAWDDCTDDELCEIIAATFRYEVDDPKYPAEWTYDVDGRPICTAFVPVGEKVPVRCEYTAEMF